MKPSYTQTFDSIAALEHRRYFNASRNKGIFLFSTGKSALHSAGSLFAREIFHSPSEEKEDYSACMLRKAEQTFLRL